VDATPQVFWSSVVVLALTIVLLAWELPRWSATVQVYGFFPATPARRMLFRTLRGFNRPVLVSAPVAAAAVSAAYLLRVDEVRGADAALIAVTFILLSIEVMLHFACPATVLLLGTSRREAVRLHYRIERGVHPYRVVAALTLSAAEPERHSWFRLSTFQLDNLRSAGSARWQALLFPLICEVPLIVVDVRVPSAGILEEVARLTQTERLMKTIFVTKDGEAAELSRLGVHAPQRCLGVVRESEVVRELRGAGLVKTSSPDEVPLIAQLSYNRNSRRLERGMARLATLVPRFAEALDRLEPGLELEGVAFAAQELLRQLRGSEGDGALEVLAGLEHDISATQAFLEQTIRRGDPRLRGLRGAGARILGELKKLERALDAAPPGFLDEIEAALRAHGEAEGPQS
jgi:hypothetical protein